jgi:hypothetical protein
VLHMIKHPAEATGLPYSTCCDTFRATGITTYLQNGGTLEHAQTIANNESPRTTKLYHRTREELRSRNSSGSTSKQLLELTNTVRPGWSASTEDQNRVVIWFLLIQ